MYTRCKINTQNKKSNRCGKFTGRGVGRKGWFEIDTSPSRALIRIRRNSNCESRTTMTGNIEGGDSEIRRHFDRFWRTYVRLVKKQIYGCDDDYKFHIFVIRKNHRKSLKRRKDACLPFDCRRCGSCRFIFYYYATLLALTYTYLYIRSTAIVSFSGA